MFPFLVPLISSSTPHVFDTVRPRPTIEFWIIMLDFVFNLSLCLWISSLLWRLEKQNITDSLREACTDHDCNCLTFLRKAPPPTSPKKETLGFFLPFYPTIIVCETANLVFLAKCSFFQALLLLNSDVDGIQSSSVAYLNISTRNNLLSSIR